MKVSKVLEKLEVTRRTLTNYVNSGKIRVTKLENGFYDYNDEDVLKIENESVVHDNRIVIYNRGNKFEYTFPPEKIEKIVKIIDII